MTIEGTGVKATEEEVAEARRLAREVSDTPLVVVHGRDLRHDVRESFMSQIDRWAVAHGLPEPGVTKDGEPNHYGLSDDGEFTRYIEDGVEHVEVP